MIEKTLDALQQLNPAGRQAVWTPGPVERVKFVEIGDTEGFATAGPLRASLSGTFYGQMGFDVMDCHATTVYADEAWEALQQLVRDHDKDQIEEVLVSATAPIGGGFAFPSDLATAALALEQADSGSVLRADHVKKVYVHAWLPRAIYVLEPGAPGFLTLAEDETAIGELKPPGLYMPDYNLNDWEATELVALGLADVFVRLNTETGERQVFVRTEEVRDGLPVWRRDDTKIGAESDNPP